MSAPKMPEMEEAAARLDATPAASDALQEHLQRLEATVEGHYATYFEAASYQVEALAELLSRLKDRHDAIRNDLPLEDLAQRVTDDPQGPRDVSTEVWRDLWHCACSYRHRFREEILAPIRSHLEANDLGSVLTGTRQSLAASLDKAVESLPEQITRDEPPDRHVEEQDDSWLLRGRKMSALLRRCIRVLIPGRDVERRQVLPLRRPARHHVQALLARQPVLDKVEERITAWMAEMERAATTATHTLLEYERRFDHLDFHHTQQAEHATLQPPEPSLDVTEALDVPPAPPSSDDVQVLQAVIEQVGSVLARGTSLSVDDLRGAAVRQLAEAVGEIRAHAGQSRSLPGNDQSLAIPPRPWEKWCDQAAQRLALCEKMLGFCDEIEVVRDRLINGVAKQGPARVEQELQEAAGQIEAQEERVEDLLQEAEAVSEIPKGRLWERLLAAASAAEEKGEALRHANLDADVREVVEASIERIQTLVEKLPAEVSVHPVLDEDAPPDASAQERVVAVQAGADVVWNELFFDELRTNAQRLSEVIAEEIGSITEIPDIVHFGREAAQKELTASEEATGERPAGEEAALENIEELAVGALSRSIQRIDGSRRRVDAATTQWADAVWKAFRQGMTGLHDRWSTENRILDRFAQISSRVSHGARGVASDAQLQVKQGQARARQWLHTARHRVRALLQRGRAAVGLKPAGEEDVHETVETLASLSEALERLPVVYRRLFSFQPVDDPDLFVGREEDQAFIAQHVQRWKRGVPTPLMLIGDRGSGMTSLLKVVRMTALREARLHHVRLAERPSVEQVLVRKVIRALQLSVSPARREVTLKDVGRALRNAPASPSIRACFVEHLEQLLLRTEGGADLLGRMLTFMSRTDARVLWIGTISRGAWQLVEQKIPKAARLVTSRRLSTLSREALEELIIRRHRRSGLDLTFDASVSSGKLPAQRLRQADLDEQEARRKAYFDRLYEESHQNVTLALLYWFRSVHLREDGGGLHVKPVRPISFSMLEQLSLEQALALKAFLVHATLTVEEYSQVMQISLKQSRDMMESLGNASLIEPVDRSSSPPARVHFDTIHDDARYRIRPLLIAPIVQHLRRRNVVH